MDSCDFDTLFTKARPHILEKICLSLDYETFKNCLEVSNAWRGILTSISFQKKAKSAFKKEILGDERKLRIAANAGKAEDVRKLLSIGMVDVNNANELGETPLYKAAKEGHRDVVKLLLDRGANPNKANVVGVVPLHWAALWSRRDVVQLLLDRRADPNKAGGDGATPLHLAVMNDDMDIVQLLLDKGASAHWPDRWGDTAHILAVDGRRNDIVNMINAATISSANQN